MFGKLKDKLKSFFKSKETPEKKEEKLVKKASEEPKETKPQKPAGKKETPQPVTTESKEIIEQPKEEKESEKKESFFSKFTKKLTSSELKKEHVEEILAPLELILLENNVALEVVDKIRNNLEKDLIGILVKKGQIENTIQKSLKDSISKVLIEPPNLLENIKSHSPYTIVFFGVNGTGKTTSIAKIASKLKKENISCVLVAADTFRAASIEQLEIHANKIGVPIVKGQYGADPTSVAFDGKQYAQKNKIQCALVDTAGRMYTKENLVKQMEKLIRIIKPELKILVIESTAGNDSIEQAKTFNKALNIDGFILSKADVDEKGGTALSVSQVTGKPIYFLGTGQELSDLQDFKKETILKNLGLK